VPYLALRCLCPAQAFCFIWQTLSLRQCTSSGPLSFCLCTWHQACPCSVSCGLFFFSLALAMAHSTTAICKATTSVLCAFWGALRGVTVEGTVEAGDPQRYEQAALELGGTPYTHCAVRQYALRRSPRTVPLRLLRHSPQPPHARPHLFCSVLCAARPIVALRMLWSHTHTHTHTLLG
jgi:hypothetical protein